MNYRKEDLKKNNENVLFTMPCNCFPQRVCVWLRICTHTIRSMQLQQHRRAPFRIRTLQLTWGRSLALFHFVVDISKLRLCLVWQTPRQDKLLRLSLPLNLPLQVSMLGRGKEGGKHPMGLAISGTQDYSWPQASLICFLLTAILEK